MTIREFLAARLGRLVLGPVAMAAAAVFLRFTGTQSGVLVILLIAWCLLFIAVQAVDYYKCRTHLEELETIMDGLDQKHLFAECVPKPQGIYERRLFALMRRIVSALLWRMANSSPSWAPPAAARQRCSTVSPPLIR